MSVTEYEEWRVTGRPGGGYPPYEFVWSAREGYDDPEATARAFVAMTRKNDWEDEPHLSRRTVTVTEWEEVET